MTRRAIESRSLGPQSRPDNLVTFYSFTDAAFASLYRELADLRTRTIILDLRDNLGGLTSDCKRFCGLFSGPGLGIGNQIARRWRSRVLSEGRLVEHRPLVLLVGPGSASASEIAAHALRSWGRATLVGQRTAGEVLASSKFPLPDGGSISVPIADFVTEEGLHLEGVGVTPDYLVEQTLEATNEGVDLQIEKAAQLLT